SMASSRRSWVKASSASLSAWDMLGLVDSQLRRSCPGCSAPALRPERTQCRSVDLRIQLTTFVALVHGFQADRLDLRGVTGCAEGFVAGDADIAHGLDGFAEELARVELAGVVRHVAADGTGGRQTQVGVDVDLAHAVFDAFNDFLDRHAVGFLDVTTVLVDDRQPLLGYRG